MSTARASTTTRRPPASFPPPEPDRPGPCPPHPITPAMRARWVEERCRLDGDPTPAEIRERCLEVQAGWDAITELSRRSVRWVAITDGHGHRDAIVPARNPIPGSEATTARRRNGGPMAR